jgi:hypothetical protein
MDERLLDFLLSHLEDWGYYVSKNTVEAGRD